LHQQNQRHRQKQERKKQISRSSVPLEKLLYSSNFDNHEGEFPSDAEPEKVAKKGDAKRTAQFIMTISTGLQ